MTLKPFWRYYGGKYRAAPLYPPPTHRMIIEPFAGAAGYSMRYPEHDVVLVDKYPVVAELWRYLIGVSEAEIRSIPTGCVHVDELPAWVPQPARHLIGWWLNNATSAPRKRMSSGRVKLHNMGRKFEGWTEHTRERVASQVAQIRHWRVFEGCYSKLPNETATWFVDPPYDNSAGRQYVEHAIAYPALGAWCRSRSGQLIVCENEGAEWLPFKPFANIKAGPARRVSAEVMYYQETP